MKRILVFAGLLMLLAIAAPALAQDNAADPPIPPERPLCFLFSRCSDDPRFAPRISYGKTVSDSMTGDVMKQYSFVATANDTITVTVATGAPVDLAIQLYKHNPGADFYEALVNGSYDGQNPTHVVDDKVDLSGDVESFTYVVPENGTYVLAVAPSKVVFQQPLNAAEANVSFTVRVDSTDPDGRNYGAFNFGNNLCSPLPPALDAGRRGTVNRGYTVTLRSRPSLTGFELGRITDSDSFDVIGFAAFDTEDGLTYYEAEGSDQGDGYLLPIVTGGAGTDAGYAQSLDPLLPLAGDDVVDGPGIQGISALQGAPFAGSIAQWSDVFVAGDVPGPDVNDPGPDFVCRDGYTWFRVTVTHNGEDFTGWIAQGDFENWVRDAGPQASAPGAGR